MRRANPRVKAKKKEKRRPLNCMMNHKYELICRRSNSNSTVAIRKSWKRSSVSKGQLTCGVVPNREGQTRQSFGLGFLIGQVLRCNAKQATASEIICSSIANHRESLASISKSGGIGQCEQQDSFCVSKQDGESLLSYER